MKKTFEGGEPIEVQSTVGAPWEPATYEMPLPDWRGWHRVTLPYLRRFDELGRDDLNGPLRSSKLTVPTKRIRALKDQAR